MNAPLPAITPAQQQGFFSDDDDSQDSEDDQSDAAAARFTAPQQAARPPAAATPAQAPVDTSSTVGVVAHEEPEPTGAGLGVGPAAKAADFLSDDEEDELGSDGESPPPVTSPAAWMPPPQKERGRLGHEEGWRRPEDEEDEESVEGRQAAAEAAREPSAAAQPAVPPMGAEADTSDEVRQLRSESAAIKSENADLKAQLELLKAQKEELRAQQDSDQSELGRLRASQRELLREIEDTRTELRKSSQSSPGGSEAEELEKALAAQQALQRELEDARSKLRKATEDMSAWEQDKRRLEHTIEEDRKRHRITMDLLQSTVAHAEAEQTRQVDEQFRLAKRLEEQMEQRDERWRAEISRIWIEVTGHPAPKQEPNGRSNGIDGVGSPAVAQLRHA